MRFTNTRNRPRLRRSKRKRRRGRSASCTSLASAGRASVCSKVPATGMAGATASLKDQDLVPQRRTAVADIRADLCAWLDKKGYAFIPSEANMVMIDGKRTGRQVAAAMLEHKVAIGRAWPSLPTHVRVTIGTREEMATFKTAFERVMEA